MAGEPKRFEHRPMDFVSVVAPRLIFIGFAKRADFDLVAGEATDHGLDLGKGHVLSKSIEDKATGTLVIFQYWVLSRTTASLLAEQAVGDRLIAGTSA